MTKDYFFNNKKAFIILLCVIALIVFAICIFIFTNSTNQKKSGFITINSRDNKYSLDLPTKFNYTIGNSSDSLSLDLYDSKNELYVYCNTIEKSREIDLVEIINEDKTSYFASKQNSAEIDMVHEIKLDNYSGYEYSMTYFDNEYGKDFYCNVVWIQTEKYIFTLNFEIPKEKLEHFKPVFDEIKNSFKLI